MAKARDDLRVLSDVGFRIKTDQISVPTEKGLVAVIRVYLVAPEGVNLEYRDGSYWYNGEKVV